MNDKISPKYQMTLIQDIENKIWAEYKGYKTVEMYILKWYEEEPGGFDNWSNFNICRKKDKEDNEVIDLYNSLHSIEDGELLLKIAIDLGVETPDFIPSIATFRNKIKSSYETASQTFEKAFRLIEEQPETSIGLVNSALESIIKEILKDKNIKTKFKPNDTLYDLTKGILKEFQMFPNGEMPSEIKKIGSSLLAINQGIEKLRSDKTDFHGKTKEDYIINDPLYTYFIVNSVATIGLFLKSFYKKKFLQIQQTKKQIEDDDLPF